MAGKSPCANGGVKLLFAYRAIGYQIEPVSRQIPVRGCATHS